jgi:hypothetical protein
MRKPLTTLDTDALKVALSAADTMMSLKQFLPSTGLLVMLLSRFRDDIRDALEMESERFPGRGKVFRPLDEMTTAELGSAWGAVMILLQDRFTDVMDDPELPRLLAGCQGDLARQRTEREQLRAAVLCQRSKSTTLSLSGGRAPGTPTRS